MHKDVHVFFNILVVRKFSLKSKLHSFNLLVGVYKTKSIQWGVIPNTVLIVNNNSLTLKRFSKGHLHDGVIIATTGLDCSQFPIFPWDRRDAIWPPVTQSARSRWSYGKIGDCEPSTTTTTTTWIHLVFPFILNLLIPKRYITNLTL